jgi:peptidoglycan/LPS O-acetylase OafA/YrhL
MLLTVIVVATVLHPTTWIGWILEHPGIRWIGRLSYSLYLWQEFFALPQAKYPISLAQSFPLNLALLFATASLSYRFIERPMIRLGHRLAPPQTPGRQDTGASL